MSSDEFTLRDRQRQFQPDEIGYWSEVKLDIIRKYASAYTAILSRQTAIRGFSYIDAFAGAGVHISKDTGEPVQGSPLNALAVRPPFGHHYFIDLDSAKVDELKAVLGGRKDVTLWQGDCNRVLLEEVFPKVKFEDYQRALCLLDPYGLHLSWDVIQSAGRMKSVEVFLNFPVMDMNMNVLWHRPDKVDPEQVARMTRYWGDESWRDSVYRPAPDLFSPDRVEKVDDANRAVALAFRARLKTEAGFAFVPEPIAMRNNKGATVYYLFFAAQRPVAAKIVGDIFCKYADRPF
ncbi:MAG: three-Cys-motif partner protein TcmP [bacterium]